MTISVCMATYNGEKFIFEQVKSILCQLSQNDELIISDDGSTDQTIYVLNSFNDIRIKIFKNTNKKGPVGNFENALSKATGDVIFLADQDDVWFDYKMATMKKHLETYDLVNADVKVVNNDLEMIFPSYYHFINSGPGFFKNLRRNTYMGNSMAFKKEIIKLAMPFPKHISNHDLWIGIVVDLFYKPYFIPEILGLHRRHSNNASNTFDIKIKTSIYKKIKKRIVVFYYLPGLFLRFILYKFENLIK